MAVFCMMIAGLTACSSSTMDPGHRNGSADPADIPDHVDVLIRGGTIHDGENTEGIVGDVGVVDDRIVFVGTATDEIPADRVIDASGMVVAPGFIDAHTHVDAQVLSEDPENRLNLPFLTQGVTTAVIGNDGFGKPDIADRAEQLRENPPGTNIAMFVGFGPIRQSQLGDADVEPDAEQMEAMRDLVATAMCEGAIGFSTGLYYSPQNLARTDEVVALAEVAAAHGGLYDSHIRDEQTPDGLRAAVDEALTIGEEADIPVHIAHIKALGADAAGMSTEIIERIEEARAGGATVTADHYPWLASSTLLSAALVPAWANADGAAARKERFDDPTLEERLREEIGENLRRRNGAEAVLFVAGGADLLGRTLAEVADDTDVDPVDAAIRILRDGDVLIANFNQTEDDVRAFMQQPWVGTSSDPSPGHPRSVGSFSEKYHEYVVPQEVLSVGEFVRSSTSVIADAFGIVDRGRIEIGHFADLVVFDPERFRANASYTDPDVLSEGIVATIVNGELAVVDDESRSVAAGRPLLRASAGTCPS